MSPTAIPEASSGLNASPGAAAAGRFRHVLLPWAVGAVALFGFGQVLAPGPGSAVGVAAWLYVGWTLRAALREDGGAHERLGAATLITLARAWLLCLLACYIGVVSMAGTVSDPVLWTVPALLYALAAICDHVDGRLARRLNQVSRLGEKLDMEIDAMGILIASILAIRFGKLPSWFLLVGLARYLFVAGLWFRRARRRPTAELDPSPLRRQLAGFQMGFLAVSLFPQVAAEITHPASWVFGGATLVVFLRDWLVVSTRFRVDTPRYAIRAALLGRVAPWILVMVRLGLGVLLVWLLIRAPSAWHPLVSWMSFVALVGLVTGFGERAASAWILGVLTLTAAGDGHLGPAVAIQGVVAGCSLVLLFGGGELPMRYLLASRPARQRRRPVQAH